MQTSLVNSLDYTKVPYQVPSDIAEFDRLAKREGAALDEANRNILYRAVLPVVRDAFLHGMDAEKNEDGSEKAPKLVGIEEATGIERKFKVTKPQVKDEATGKITTEERTAWDESEQKYWDRVKAQLVADGKFPSADAVQAAYASLFQSVLDRTPFDPAKEPRESGPRKTPKTYYEIADELIKLASGDVSVAVAKFNAKTGQTVDSTRDALAKGIWDDQTAKRKAIAQSYAE